jgi:hypothetical protein
MGSEAAGAAGSGTGRRAGVGCRVGGGVVTACPFSSRAVAAVAAAAESADADGGWGEVQSEAGRAWQMLTPRPPPRSRPSFLEIYASPDAASNIC